jgi:hypothetical protein
MKPYALAFIIVAFTTSGAPPAAAGQAEGKVAASPAQSLRIQIVIARSKGDKKISNVPYELSVRSDGSKAQLRMGTEVPVTTPFGPVKMGADSPPANMQVNYRTVGTNIDAEAQPFEGGRYRVDLFLEESSLLTDTSSAGVNGLLPRFHAFRSGNTLILRDGQTTQFTAATDRITGESITVAVTLSLLK